MPCLSKSSWYVFSLRFYNDGQWWSMMLLCILCQANQAHRPPAGQTRGEVQLEPRDWQDHVQGRLHIFYRRLVSDGDVWQCSEWSYLLTKLPVSSQWVKVMQTCIMHPNFNWQHLIHFNTYLHWCLLIDSFSSILWSSGKGKGKGST